MARATSSAVESFIKARFVLVDNVGPFIPNSEIARLMEELMREFDGIYCGAMPDKAAGKIFTVRSSKTNRYFCRMRVKQLTQDGYRMEVLLGWMP